MITIITIILGICLVLSIASNFLLPYFLTKEHAKEKAQLHDRLMSRDYPEFMQGKDYELELKKKEKEIDVEPKEKPKLNAADLENKIAAEQY